MAFFVVYVHPGDRLLGWWSIDEGSREEQARLYSVGTSGSVISFLLSGFFVSWMSLYPNMQYLFRKAQKPLLVVLFLLSCKGACFCCFLLFIYLFKISVHSFAR